MKRTLALLLAIVLLLPCVAYAQEVRSDQDALFEDVFLAYADKLGTISYADASEEETLGYTVEYTKPSKSNLGAIEYTSGDGLFYVSLMFFPDGNDDTSEKDRLCLVTYGDNDTEKCVSVSNELHQSMPVFKSHDPQRSPINCDEVSILGIHAFYTMEMGGEVPLSSVVGALSDSANAQESKITGFVKKTVENYTKTDVDDIRVNPNAGTDETGDVIVLVYLTWNVKNKPDTTKEMLEMYSGDLAARIAAEEPDVSELCIFWAVPYYDEDTVAKFQFERVGENMRFADTMYSNQIR